MTVAAIQAVAQSFTLRGRVTDQDMNPVELATVSVAKQGKIAFTSLKGEFSMQLMSADSVVVKFSMIGYKTKTRVLRRPRGKQTLQIVLHTEDNMIDEVQVTGEKIQTSQTQELKTKDGTFCQWQCCGEPHPATGRCEHPQRTVITIQCARRCLRRELCIY